MKNLGVEILKDKYLGVEIVQDKYFGVHTSAVTCGAYLGSDDIKKDIRKLVLPTYQPTKTLEWLQEQTNSVWYYQNYGEVLWTVSSSLDAEIRYNICTNILTHENLGSEFGQSWTVTPREFIEKIVKGEWV